MAESDEIDDKAGAFLKDLLTVCRHHRMRLHPDADGFTVEPLRAEAELKPLVDAWIGENFSA